MYKLKLGADPELFLKKGRSYVCANGVIGGTKYAPLPVHKGAVQVDGMAVEFNIDPAESADEFVENIKAVMEKLDEMVGEHRLICLPSVTFNEKVWKGSPDEAKILGCEPDFNAWTGEENIKPNGDQRFRTAAGHIHIGWTEGKDITDQRHINECEAVVKELDFRLGYPSLFIDKDNKRRTLYGKAGAYRPKSYGVEYRVLSNFWLLDEKYQRWVWNVVEDTLKDLFNKHNLVGGEHHKGRYSPPRIINDGKRKDAYAMINAYKYKLNKFSEGVYEL